MVLQCACHDFTGGCRTFIDQHHHRYFLQCSRQCFQSLGARQAANITGGSPQDLLAFRGLAVGGYHRHVIRQEGRRHGYRSGQEATGVIAQVEHQAFDFGVLLVDFVHFLGEIFEAALLELTDADPSVAWLHHFSTDGLLLDFFPNDRDREGAIFFLAEDGQQHFGIGLAPHPLHGFVQGQPFDRGVIDFGDQVIGFEASAEGGRPFNGRDDFDKAVLLGNFDADTHKLSGGTFPEFFECLFIEIL